MSDNACFDDLKKAFTGFSEASVFLYEETGSTNDEAKRYAKEGATDDAIFIAVRQTGGRGRLGRSFSSDEGGLYISYLFHPELMANDAILMTVYAAVALCEVIEEMTPIKPKIKWVNDVFAGGKKLAGILTEGQVLSDGGLGYAIVGIGVNVWKREFSEDLAAIATDIETECGVRISIADLALKLSEKMLRFERAERCGYMDKYRAYSLVIGKRLTVVTADGSYEAEAISIDDSGALTVKDGEGRFIRLFTGEVSVRL
jgi:BirA family biotin operon repressor/biotin-[acetyl-CoA-carboxylase] ligase